MKKNVVSNVQKSMSPDEMAVISQIESLIEELEAGGMGGEGGPEENEGHEGMPPEASMAMKNNPMVSKADEQTRQEGADTVTQPEAKNPEDKGMAPWGNEDEVKKAFATIAKSIQASDTEGVTANDPGDERAESLPETDEENVKEVAKALLSVLGKRKVAKSYNQPSNNVNNEMIKVMKSMSDKINQQGVIIGEILEGLGASSNVIQSPVTNSVQKSNDNRPYNNAVGADMIETIASVVAKSLEKTGPYRQSESGIPVAKGFDKVSCDGGQAIKDFTEGFVGISQDKWGNN